MGMSCSTEFAFSFIYKVKFENGLTEHEFDHVYYGITDQIPTPEKSEVMNWEYISLKDLGTDLELNPEKYTEWIKLCWPALQQYMYAKQKNKQLKLEEQLSN
jgi:isopentenyl-diphosphate delta-isomerase